jgi:hypothetical protein
MTTTWSSGRRTLALGAVTAVLVTNLVAAVFAGGELQWLLYASAAVATLTAVLAVTSSGEAIAGAFLFSLPAVLALLASDGGRWLIGPLGALLLLAGELSAWSWEYAGVVPAEPEVMSQRGLDVARLAGLGLLASVAVGVAGLGRLPGGSAAVVVAAIAVAALARLTFARR